MESLDEALRRMSPGARPRCGDLSGGRNEPRFSADPLVGQTIAKRYRLARRLGTGYLGAVYLATELATGKQVALKVLAREIRCDEETLTQCRWDARFAAASDPSSIARVFEVDRTDEGQVFIAMEYVVAPGEGPRADAHRKDAAGRGLG